MIDQTLNLALHPYTFISRVQKTTDRDVFETRINLQKTICMTGEEAGKIFYDKDLFSRRDAAPLNLRTTLFGSGAVHGLDGEAHFIRKQMFMSLMTPESIQTLVGMVRDAWRARLATWQQKESIVLADELSSILCEGVCAWTGVPLDNAERRAAESNAMIAGGAGGIIRFGKAIIARKSSEAWVCEHVRKLRDGSLKMDKANASQVIAFHREANGKTLSDQVAAVELINVIRPTIAVSRFIVYVALALEQFPQMRPRTQEEKNLFILEVKRYYPFFPIVAARVRKDFSWRGFHFEKGRRALFDLYGTNHDRRVWSNPQRFYPGRFREKEDSHFAYVPQGGSEHASNHRCPGESATSSLMLMGLDMLLHEISYDVPKQNLHVNMATAPAGPKSGFVIKNVRMKA